MADSRTTHILLFHEDLTNGEGIGARLHDAGFTVTRAKTFIEAAEVLVAGRVNLFLVYLPETEWVRNAILTEVRRANPALPIVALTPSLPTEVGHALARLHSATLLPTSTSWGVVVETLHGVIAASQKPPRCR